MNTSSQHAAACLYGGTTLVGQWVARESTGVHDELLANALVLDDDRTRLALVSCDVLPIGNTTKRAIRDVIGRETDIDPDNVFLCATHNGCPKSTEILKF